MHTTQKACYRVHAHAKLHAHTVHLNINNNDNNSIDVSTIMCRQTLQVPSTKRDKNQITCFVYRDIFAVSLIY